MTDQPFTYGAPAPAPVVDQPATPAPVAPVVDVPAPVVDQPATPAPVAPVVDVPATPAPVVTPPAVGSVVRFDVPNPYGANGYTVDTFVGLVVGHVDGAATVAVLGNAAELAHFPAEALRV